MIKTISVRKTHLLPGFFLGRANSNRSYLLKLDSQCLLQNYYWVSGIIIPGLQVIDEWTFVQNNYAFIKAVHLAKSY